MRVVGHPSTRLDLHQACPDHVVREPQQRHVPRACPIHGIGECATLPLLLLLTALVALVFVRVCFPRLSQLYDLVTVGVGARVPRLRTARILRVETEPPQLIRLRK